MEKYRKFEDQTNGINPFIPNSVKKRSFILKLIYMYVIYLLFKIKTFFIKIKKKYIYLGCKYLLEQ